MSYRGSDIVSLLAYRCINCEVEANKNVSLSSKKLSYELL
jgi:hypothetical protein